MEVIVTNLQQNHDAISATAAPVVRRLADQYALGLAGSGLPGCPEPLSVMQAIRLSRKPSNGRRHVIWHVRRSKEMRAALFARDILRCPIRIVYTVPFDLRRPPSRRLRWMMSRIDCVIGTTRADARRLPNIRALVHNGVDTESFHPAEDRLQAWVDSGNPGKIGIATFGEIGPANGSDLFVEAMIRLLPDHPEVTALVIGATTRHGRSFEKKLHDRIAASGLDERIRVTGDIDPKEMPEVLRSLSLMVAPARRQDFSLISLQAMASGVPLIATRTGYNPIFIGDDEAGIIVPEPNTGAIAEAIDVLLRDPLRRGALNATARDRAVSRFSIDNEIQGINRVYEEVWSGEPD